MKITRSEALNNREAILQAAAAQLLRKGVEKLNVADVAREARLTHGALYNKFNSKDSLASAAITRAFETCVRRFTELSPAEFVDEYLSTKHRDHPDDGCPTSALASEIPRQTEEFRVAFRDGFHQFLSLLEHRIRDLFEEESLDKAYLILSTLIGSLALSRALRGVDEERSVALLRSVSRQLSELMTLPGRNQTNR